MEKSDMANNASPYPTLDQTNFDSATAPPSYEQSQFQGNPAGPPPNQMKPPYNPNADGDLRQRQVSEFQFHEFFFFFFKNKLSINTHS
jgi:hypothetical protein